MNVLHDSLKNPKYAPCPLLVSMVESGYKGVKTGEGFYKYTEGSKEMVVSERLSTLNEGYKKR
jgi:3-hydroxybutyryl-CoA dehydrogenase